MPRISKVRKTHEPRRQIRGPEGEYSFGAELGSIIYKRNFLGRVEADRLFADTVDARSWERTPIKIFGREVLQARDTAFFGSR